MSAAILDGASWALLLTGGVFGVIGGIGVVRLPDFYARLHASSVTDTMAAYLILLGLMLQAGFTLAAGKLALILFFLFFTGPTAAHALANTAYHDGLHPWTRRAGPPRGPKPEAPPQSGADAATDEAPPVQSPAFPDAATDRAVEGGPKSDS